MCLYIDPGTGSMLITILIGLLGSVLYFFNNLFVKLKNYSGKGGIEVQTDKFPLVIYSDHKRYWKVFEPICDELEKRKIKTVFLTQSDDDPVLDKDYEYIESEFIGAGNKGLARMNYLHAKVVLSTTPSLDVFQWKRSKNVDFYIHINHGANDYPMYRMFGLDYYDAILLSGEYQEHQIRKLEELRELPNKELEYIGIPFFDYMKARIDNMPARKLDDNRTVLLAPSWGKSGLLSKYGEKLIDCLIDTGYKVVIRPHPQSITSEKKMLDNLMKKYPDSDKLSWNYDNDNFDILYNSDILISDFSGVLFEYSLVFDKPILYMNFEYDKSPYDCAWLEEEMWTFEILPHLGIEINLDNYFQIKEKIDECLNNDKYAEGRKKARRETWMYQGEGVKRTVDYLEKKIG